MSAPWSRDFERLSRSQDWFEIYRLAPDLFVFHEPRHWEETNATLVVGADEAVLIDTGCGIGDLRSAVARCTELPVTVLLTHTHADHLGSARQFERLALFDHPVSRRVAQEGVPLETLENEILDARFVTPPWPPEFDRSGFAVPPLDIDRWLVDGEALQLADRCWEVLHTPGEAPNHTCLLDRSGRVLFCGDILLRGAVWTHLEGGSLEELTDSYRKLMNRYDDFDWLMPSHNEPWLDKSLLPEALAGAERVAAGKVVPTEVVDPWGRTLHRYVVGRFELLTRAEGG